jgi:hypothetical protein
MTEKYTSSVMGSGRTTVLWAQGHHGFDGVACSRTSRGRQRHGLGEDDGAMGLRMAWVDVIVGLGTVWGTQCRRLGEDDGVAGSGMAS